MMNDEIVKMFLEQPDVAIAVFDRNMHYLSANASWFSLFKLEKNNLNIVGKPHYEISPNSEQKWKNVVERCLEGSTEIVETNSFFKNQENTAKVIWKFQPWYVSTNQIGGVIVLGDVVTPPPGNAENNGQNHFSSQSSSDSLIHHEAQLSALIKAMDDLVFEFNLDGTYRKVWGRSLFQLIHSEKELIGKKPSDLFEGDFPVLFSKAHQQVLTTNQSTDIEYSLLIKGVETWFYSHLSPILLENNTCIGVAMVARDITQRKLIEQALTESEERFRTAFEEASVGIAHVSKDGQFMRVNKRFCEIVGYNQDELLQKTFQMITVPEDLSEDVENTKKVLSGEIIRYEMEKRYYRKDGQIIWVNLNVSLAHDAFGEPYFISAIDEITNRKKIEEELSESRTLLNDAETIANLGSWRLNLTTNKLHCSDGMFRLFEVNKDEFSGDLDQLISSRIHPDDKAFIYQSLAEIPQIGKLNPIEYRIILPSGKTRILMSEGNLLRNTVDDSQILTGYVIDITERKMIEQLVETQTKELARSNTDLEQFAYMISHDLQEPLRMVISYLQLLSRRYSSKLDKDADEFIHFAVDGASRMQKLISELLEYSRIGTRGKEFCEISTELCFEHALNNLEIAIKENKAVITHDDLPMVVGDDTQITQLFQNLMGNAIKFHGEDIPKIHLAVKKINADNQKNHWQFSVSDNGIGIEPKFYERIFIIFQRLHTKENYQGAGVGLAFCKKIVERHGGQIWVEANQPQGSIFHFTLPASEEKN